MIVPEHRLLLWAAWVGLPLATLAGAVAAAQVPALVTLGLLLAVVASDALLSWKSLHQVSASCPQLLRLSRGNQGRLELELHTPPGTQTRLQLALTLPDGLATDSPELQVVLGGDSGRHLLDWPIHGRERGRHEITRCQLATSSRFGCWQVRRELELDGEVRVYPNLREERRTLASHFLHRGGLGAHAQRQIGKGREFEKLREYLPGDSLDDIHWKASAKRGQPVTKELQIERTQEVYAVLDTSRLLSRELGREPALERTLRAALMLALATRQYGDMFGLLTFNDQIRSFLPARAGKAQYNACREAIFTLSPAAVSPDFTEVATFIRLRMRRRALLVFLTDLDDPALAEDFVRAADLIGRHHLVLVTMMQPPAAVPLFSAPADDRDQVVEHLAGHLQWHRLRELGRVLERRGVGFALLGHDSLASDVVSRYVAVKRRQIL